MEPGKIPHELRQGELAQLGLIPHRPYYGTADATPLYIVLLHRAWALTGDRSLIEQHVGTAERCLSWIDRFGDRDGDGFQEYQRRTEDGAENQGWKDAGNAVMDVHGDLVQGPKALCELQGYVYDAWRRMAAIYDALDRSAEADILRGKAQDLQERFNEVFWDPETKAYAYCLDGNKRRIMTTASNPGHLLWSGIVPEERAGPVVERLLADDMWSGWGVRTLSAAHPAYNPHDYQSGAIWPHDNGFVALGMKQYGFHAEAAQIARGIIEAGSHFLRHRLPEVFAGVSRRDALFPVQYLGANVPQAWAAGSVFTLLQAILGLQPDAASGTLYADPTLPEWLPDIRISNFHVGAEVVDLHVWREEGKPARTRIALTSSGRIKLVERPFGHALHLAPTRGDRDTARRSP